MKWFIIFLCLLVPSSAFSSGSSMNKHIQRKLDETKQFQLDQSRKFEELIQQLRNLHFKNRREIPNGVRIPKRSYRGYKK